MLHYKRAVGSYDRPCGLYWIALYFFYFEMQYQTLTVVLQLHVSHLVLDMDILNSTQRPRPKDFNPEKHKVSFHMHIII